MPDNNQCNADNIRQLTPLGSITIDQQWEDDNGHINICFYMDMYSESGWSMFEQIGINRDYFLKQKLGVVDLENHFRYWRELHVGNQVTAYARFLNHDKKRIHGVFFIVNDETNELACSIEFLALNIDQRLRKSGPFPDQVLQNIASQVKADEKLEWQFPSALTLERP